MQHIVNRKRYLQYLTIKLTKKLKQSNTLALRRKIRIEQVYILLSVEENIMKAYSVDISRHNLYNFGLFICHYAIF